MKKINYYLSFIAVFSLFLTSCSTEDPNLDNGNQETIQIQFGTLLNDFESKVHLTDPMACRDADPSYVLVGITDSDGNFVGEDGGTPETNLIRVDIQNNNNSWETSYSDELGLPAGEYSLEYFIVYSEDGEVLWVAPREGGDYASSVTNPLPQVISLAAGTKPYINVDVLCFIPRQEVAYGYLFFDINLITVVNNFCIFVNFCDDETGREYPAKFMVDVWADGYDGSEMVIDGRMNGISMSGNNPAASVLCFPLPPLDGDDTYFVRVTVMNDAMLAYNTDGLDTYEFEIDQDDIDAQIDTVPAYEHVRINCDSVVQ